MPRLARLCWGGVWCLEEFLSRVSRQRAESHASRLPGAAEVQGSGVQCCPPAHPARRVLAAGQSQVCRPGQAPHSPLLDMALHVACLGPALPVGSTALGRMCLSSCSRSQWPSGEQEQSPSEDGQGVRPATCCSLLCVRLKRPRWGLRDRLGEWAFPQSWGSIAGGTVCTGDGLSFGSRKRVCVAGGWNGPQGRRF